MPFLNRSGWTVTADATAGGSPANVIDGNPATYWQPPNFGQPHSLMFDMGSPQTFDTIGILNLAGGGANNVRVVNLYVSTDGISWGSPVETITFTNETDDPDYWALSTSYTFRYFKLSMSSFNSVFMAIAEVNAGTLTAYAVARPTSFSIITGTCGDTVLNPGNAIDAEPGVPPGTPTTFATVQQLACGAFSDPAHLNLSAIPSQLVTGDSFVRLTVWTALQNGNSGTLVDVYYNGVLYDKGVAGIDGQVGPYSLQKNSWILPGVSDVTLLQINFTNHHSAGGLVSPNNLYVYDCFIEVGFATAPTTGYITVKKVTSPSGSPQSFTFTPSWGAPFNLTDGGSSTSTALAPGTYSVVETPVSHWTTVWDADPTTIVVVAGEITLRTATNTFTNPTGNIIVVKATQPPGSPQVFTFTPSWGAMFTLTDGQQHDSGPLAPGTYSVSEAPVVGWDTITNRNPAVIVLGAGDTIIVIFTNTQVGCPVCWSFKTPELYSFGGSDPFFLTKIAVRGISAAPDATITLVRQGQQDPAPLRTRLWKGGGNEFILQALVNARLINVAAIIAGCSPTEIHLVEWDATPKPVGVPLDFMR